MRFEGAFSMPAFAIAQAPFPVQGPGALVVEREGLRVEGSKAGTALGCLVGVAWVGVAMTCVTILMTVAFGGVDETNRMGMKLAGAALVAVFLFGPLFVINHLWRSHTRAARTRKPLTMLLPWSSISSSAVDGDALHIRVTNHKPLGVIVFHTASPGALLSAMTNGPPGGWQ
jgi:hypothetical protein